MFFYQSLEKNNETLLIKNEIEVNHKQWLKALLDSINQTTIPKSQDNGPTEKTCKAFHQDTIVNINVVVLKCNICKLFISGLRSNYSFQ